MLELLTAGALGVIGHMKSKDFVHRRLRFTNVIEKPGIGLAAGVGTALATGAVVSMLPIVGGLAMGAGIGAGLGVGTGVAIGARRAKEGPPPDDF